MIFNRDFLNACHYGSLLYLKGNNNMTMENFIEIIKRHCKIGLITPDSRLVDDLSMCSFDMMMIITESENEYRIHYSFQTIERIITVADFYYQFK